MNHNFFLLLTISGVISATYQLYINTLVGKTVSFF